VFVVVFGDRRTTLPVNWTKETAVAILGDATLDSSAGAAPHASLTFVGIGSDLELRVPSGSQVRESGFSLIGDREIQVSPGQGPEISVRVFGLFNDVKVTDQSGE
jgi:hypothetical protein